MSSIQFDAKSERWALPGFFIFLFTISMLGLHWGLPSIERKNLVLPPERQSNEMYEKLADAHQKIPPRFEDDPVATLENKEIYERQRLNSIGSFIVRALDGDEQLTLKALSKIKPQHGQFDPGYYAYGGPYLAGVGSVMAVGLITGSLHLTSDIKFYYAHPEMMAKIFYWGRLFSVLSYLLCIAAFYYFSRIFMKWPWAMAISLIFALTPINIYLAKTLKPHLLASFFAILGFIGAYRIYISPSWKNYLFTSVMMGLAVGTTVNLYPLPILIMVVHLFSPQSRSRMSARIFEPRLWLALISSVIVYFMVNPYIFLNFGGWLSELTHQASERKGNLNLTNVSYVFSGILWRGAGPVLSGIGLIGILFGAARKWRKSFVWPIFIFLSIYFLLIILQFGPVAFQSHHHTRYIVPFLALMAVIGGTIIESWVPSSKRISLILMVGLVMWPLAQSTMAIKNYMKANPQDSINIVAGHWIMDHIPAGTTIGMFTNPMLDRQPPFDFDNYQIQVIGPGIEIDPNSAPEYFILSANPTLHYFLDHPHVVHPNFSDVYRLEKVFRRPADGLFKEYYASANYGFWIYRKKEILSSEIN